LHKFHQKKIGWENGINKEKKKNKKRTERQQDKDDKN